MKRKQTGLGSSLHSWPDITFHATQVQFNKNLSKLSVHLQNLRQSLICT